MNNISNVSIEKNLKENSNHGDYTFPVDIHQDYFPASSENEQHCILCHWHPEVEILLVTKGSLHSQVNLKEYEILPGEAIFVNANQLHAGYPTSAGDTRLHSFFLIPAFFMERKAV